MTPRTACCLLASVTTTFGLLTAESTLAQRPGPVEWELVGTYATGLADIEEGLTSGEVAALHDDLLFVANASDVSVDIVDVSDPATPQQLDRVDLSAHGDTVTSVAVSTRLVAVTVERGTSPGRLVVFSHDGDDLRSAVVGAGPDMVTFTANGRLIAVANEGENNAIAVLDLAEGTVERIDALGFKDHSAPGAGIDASDQDGGINIQSWEQVLGMYQPDALAVFRDKGRDYVLSANEGDAREYDGLEEASRLRSTTTDESFGPTRANEQLGRLNVTTSAPGTPTEQATAYSFGTRSFSVWNGRSGDLVFDSDDALEQLTAAERAANFNSNNDENSFDNRSDDKGPEPEAAAVGVVRGRTYGFIGLERIGGIAVIDLDDPESPEIVQYLDNRDFTGDEVGPDSGPEVIDFVPAHDSPSGEPMIVVANEITGTVSMYSPS